MSLKITMDNFKEVVLAAKKPVLVKFHAQWCGSCKILNSILANLSEEVGEKALITDIDIDKNEQLAALFKVRSIPTILIFKDGKIVNHHSGLLTKNEILNLLNI